MLAEGGQCVADMAALRDQADLFGEVASAPTIWRAVSEVDDKVLDALRRGRAQERAKVWASGGAPEQVILDVDAALVEVHSENKESAASHFKGGYGFHPMFCFADHSGEALASICERAMPPPTPVPTDWPWSTWPSPSSQPSTEPATAPGDAAGDAGGPAFGRIIVFPSGTPLDLGGFVRDAVLEWCVRRHCYLLRA